MFFTDLSLNTISARNLTGLTLLLCALASPSALAAPAMNIHQLRCENVPNPLGIEEGHPQLAWKLASQTRGAQQVAYRVLVASRPELLAKDQGDLWDSGQVRSGETTHITYAGKPLSSHQRCHWKVRVVDEVGKAFESQPAFWEMGLLNKSDWHGQWIGYVAPKVETDAVPNLEKASWIWYPEGDPTKDAPIATRWFRHSLTVPSGRAVQSARLRVAADNSAVIYLNGKEIGRGKDSWKSRKVFDLRGALVPGNNVLAVSVTNEGTAPGPAGLAAQLDVTLAGGESMSLLTDGEWKASNQQLDGWQNATFNDADWQDAKVLVPVGEGPWGKVASGSIITAPPAPYLRHTFTLDGKVKRATAYICGLGWHELSLNGHKVGDHVLDPAWTNYDHRALYVAHDVTGNLKTGRNAVGVILGTGHYDDHVLAAWDFDKASWRDNPKLMLELRVEYEDGRQQVISSNGDWKASTGPILFDSISGGERYDARLEKAGWDTADYNDANWQKVAAAKAIESPLVAQTAPPIKVTQTLRPVKVTEVKPGVFIYDMGQNFAGVPELHVSGPAGTKVVMRCAEKLREDGTLDPSNIDTFVKRRDAEQLFQNDSYVLKGQGREVWSPRFTYHGFQYVEVTGFPGKPTLDNLRGLVQHSAFDTVGTFECSDEMLNHTQRNAVWAYISNFHGYPSDCPQREKNGWMGDAHLAAEMGLYNFDAAANYERWLDDIADHQNEQGALPGIVPTGGWGFAWGNGPAWDSAYPLIVWYLYQYRDDKRVLAKHYDRLKKYVDYVGTRSKEESIVAFGLGDWLAPKTKTPLEVTDTGYYYADTRIVAQIAEILGKSEDAHRYSAVADSIKTAFNKKFYDPQTHRYANGSLTAQSCALYQGLVPEENKTAVVEALIDEIKKQGYHMDVGILGAKYILNALAENGRLDVAYQMLMVRTEPSYGRWIERGATTLWEEWNGNQSRNHIMFGDVSAWFFKYLAGIRATSPGFKSIVLQPHMLGLTSAKASYDSVRGRIVSDWKIEDDTFRWQATVPPNTSATIMVPCTEGATVTESGKAITEKSGLRFLRRENGYAVYAAEAGSYRLSCDAAR